MATAVERSRPLMYWLVVAAFLGGMAAVQFVTARAESQTYDESNQLLSGYTYLRTGHFFVGVDQPPLTKLLWALPVALLRPTSPAEENAVIEDPAAARREFLYHNRVAADSMLLAGRIPAIAISVLLGITIAAWAKRHFTAPVGLLAIFLYSLDPNFIANGRYIKNDVAAALLIFATVMAWGGYLVRPERRRLLLAGFTLGLALATKFSTLVLLPVLLLLYGIRRWQEGRRAVPRAQSLVFAGLIAAFVVFAIYGFEIKHVEDSGVLQRIAPKAIGRLPLPMLSYFRGVRAIATRQTEVGSDSLYLMGQHARFGWWYMSLVSFAVKTPLSELALFLLAAALALLRLPCVRLRTLRFEWFLLTIPPAVYFTVSLLVHLNAGLRHLLPIYPFLFVASAALLLGPPTAAWRKLAAFAIAGVLMAESAAIYPHYLAFFNVLAGGPVGGPRYLADSNIDWGQDVKYLKQYMDSRQIPQVCISYFGMADLDYYGVRHRELPPLPDVSSARQLDCVAAVSVTNLASEPQRYAALEKLTPDARIGYSIYVYDLRKPASTRSPAGQ